MGFSLLLCLCGVILMSRTSTAEVLFMKKSSLYKVRTESKIILIPQSEILPNPNQPRKRFNYDELEGLAQSIRANGILQPLLVRTNENGKYELVAGERRLRAARLVGITKVPCILNDISESDSAVFAIIENLQRSNLSFLFILRFLFPKETHGVSFSFLTSRP